MSARDPSPRGRSSPSNPLERSRGRRPLTASDWGDSVTCDAGVASRMPPREGRQCGSGVGMEGVPPPTRSVGAVRQPTSCERWLVARRDSMGVLLRRYLRAAAAAGAAEPHEGEPLTRPARELRRRARGQSGPPHLAQHHPLQVCASALAAESSGLSLPVVVCSSSESRTMVSRATRCSSWFTARRTWLLAPGIPAGVLPISAPSRPKARRSRCPRSCARRCATSSGGRARAASVRSPFGTATTHASPPLRPGRAQ